MIFYDVGLLTESEFVDVFDMSPKEIKGYKPISCKNEEGEVRNFYVVTLKGIDPDLILSMRRCRLSHEVSVEQNEFQLLLSEQLTSQQGKDWFAFASKGHFEKVRPFRPTAKSSLKAGSDVNELWERLNREREAKIGEEEENASHNGSEVEDVMDQLDNASEAKQPSGPKHMQIGDAASMLGSTFAVPQDKPKKKRKTAVEDDDEEMPEEAGSNASSQLAHLQQVDNDMFLVAKRHALISQRPTPSCLFNMNVVKQLTTPGKIGSILYGVARSFH